MAASPLARWVRIGAVAKSVGVSPDTVRHYERLGLLEPAARSEGGFRLYEAAAIRRAQVVQAALRAGFSLNELAGIFAERRAGRAPCLRVRALAAEKLAAVEAELRRLRKLRQALRGTLADWDERLRTAPAGRMVGLLEALATAMTTETAWTEAKRPLRGRARKET